MASVTAALAAILVATSGSAFAAQWSAVGTGLPTVSLGVTALAIDPATPSTLYTLTRGGVIFKSTDGGGSWQPSNGIVGVNFLAIDPRNSSTLYAMTRHGVVKSTNGGGSWTSANNGLPDGTGDSLAISPVDSATLYAVASGGIFKSANSGTNWNAVGSGSSPATRIVGPLVIDPAASSTIYAPFSGRGIIKSLDGGETWTAINPTSDFDYGITSLAIDPLTSSTLYAGFYPTAGGAPTGGVFKSTDGGKTWAALREVMPAGTFATSITVDPVTPSTLYAIVNSGGSGGLVRSTDGGQSWNAVQDGLPSNFSGPLAIDPSSGSTLYAGFVDAGAGAVFKSTQSGGSWKRSDAGLVAVDARALAIDPVNTANIYAGVGDGVFRQSGSGAGWNKLASLQIRNSFSLIPGGQPLSGPAPAYLRSLAVDFVNPNNLYAWTSRGNGCVVFDSLLFKSTDGGANWSDSTSPPKNPCVLDGLLVMDPTDQNTLYVVESDRLDGGYWVRKSVDAGSTWSDIWPSQDYGPNALLVDPASHATLYAGTGSGVCKSADGGANWKQIGLADANVTALAIAPAGAGVLYAATAATDSGPQGFRGLFKSSDSGANWAPAGSGLAGLTGVGAIITCLVVAPNNTVYAGTSGDGVYTSADGGASWLKFSDGLPNLDIRALVLAPGTANALYVATAGGIFTIVDAQ